jgi:hypothetical protein
MLFVALEQLGVRQVINVVRAAIRTRYLAIGPAKADHETVAVFRDREVLNRFLQSAW